MDVAKQNETHVLASSVLSRNPLQEFPGHACKANSQILTSWLLRTVQDQQSRSTALGRDEASAAKPVQRGGNLKAPCACPVPRSFRAVTDSEAVSGNTLLDRIE